MFIGHLWGAYRGLMDGEQEVAFLEASGFTRNGGEASGGACGAEGALMGCLWGWEGT